MFSADAIKKIENASGTIYLIGKDLKNYKEEFQKLILQIIEDKKLPFSNVYIKIPTFLGEVFVSLLWEKNLKVKETEIRHDYLMIRF